MSPVHSLVDESAREESLAAAAAAVKDGRLVVLPTDTLYGIGADAFHPGAVRSLLAAKQRGSEMPPPVLVPNPRTLDGLAIDVHPYVRRLVKAFWPGALTVVVKAQPSLAWDLGDTNGTVALRMPDHEQTLMLLAEVGPMAVSSANLHGQPAATQVMDAAVQLGPAVDVYLDGGEAPGGRPSTIIDCTRTSPCILRLGAVTVERIEEVLGEEVHLRLSPSEPVPGDEAEPQAAPTVGGGPAHEVPGGQVRPDGLAAAAEGPGPEAWVDGDGRPVEGPHGGQATRFDLIPGDDEETRGLETFAVPTHAEAHTVPVPHIDPEPAVREASASAVREASEPAGGPITGSHEIPGLTDVVLPGSPEDTRPGRHRAR